MKRITIVLFVALFVPTALAQQRYYIAVGMGRHYAPGVDFENTSNDRASICDEYINPQYALVDGCSVLDRGVGAGWRVAFDNARGMNGSLAWGMQFTRRIRAEIEYSYLHSDYDESSYVGGGTGATANKLGQEIQTSRERLGSVSSNSFLLSAHYVVPRRDSRWTLYAGLGAGISALAADYTSTWARNSNPAAIRTGEGQPNVDEIRTNLAGTVSAGDAELTAVGLSWHIVAGADYLIAGQVSLGFRLRRIDFPMLESQDLVWDPSRSHVPNLRLDGSEPVHGIIRTEDFQAVTLSMVMRYHF